MNGMIHPVPDHTLPDNCEREPIRVPGSIQPHGALLAFDPMTGAVLHSSDNLGQFLSLGSLPVHDRFLADMMEPGAAQAVMDSVRQSTQGSTNTPLKLRVASPLGGADGELDAAVHVYRGVGFLEVEAALDDPVDWLPTFTETMQSMRDCSSVEALMSHVAGRVKRLSGFDQVMVYRFDESWNGQVIAERCEADMEPFLGLHYPASDIPPQARDLYLTNLVRLIVDTQYVPVPVRPQVDVRTSQPLDMSHAQLRSVSPMHLQYLQNMGVRSTLVMSIVVEGRLWGLISCHHRKPRRVSMVLRNACKLLVLSLGYLLTAQLQIQTQRHRQSLAEMQVQLLKAFNQPHVPLSDIVESVATELLQLGSAAAGLLWHGHEVHAFGPGVGGEQGRQLVEAIQQALQLRPGDPLFLTRPTPELEGMMSGLGFCGLGALALGPFADSGLIWLRPEWVRNVHWGGNPDKAMNLSLDAKGQPILTPRNSFAKFLQVARGESRPWDERTQQAIAGLSGVYELLVVRESLAKVVLSDRRFRSLVALQSDCYWQTDAEGRIMVLSRDLGFGLASVQRHVLTALYEGRVPAASVELLAERLAAREPFRDLAMSAGDEDGADFFSHTVSGEAIRDRSGVVVGMHGTISDVTARRREEMRRVAAELRANQAAAAKSSFLAMMSHEIRTPMNGVMGYLELLAGEPLNPKALQYVESARGAGAILTHVLNDVLDLSRIEAGMLELSPRATALRPLFAEVVALVSAEAGRKQLRVDVQLDPGMPAHVWTDDLRLRQILLNLLNNAVKFTERGEVRLAVQVREGDGASMQLCFEVSDTGIGMSDEQLVRALEPFQQADQSITRRYGGSGLGLSITQRLLGLMGSAGLAIRSSPGQGTVVSFEIGLELADEADLQVVNHLPLAELPPGLRVLLVEDSSINIDVVAAVFEQLGVDISVALNGAEALELLDRLGPAFDVILMDLQMPVMDGLTATARIREREDLAVVPIVGLTANAYDSDRDRCLQAGMVAFVTKPYTQEALVRSLLVACRADPRRAAQP